MRLAFLFVFCLLYKNNLCKKKKISIDEALGKKFKFQLFENFNGCKELYIQERNMVTKLIQVKQKLLEAQKNFRERLYAGVKKDRGDVLLSVLRIKTFSTLNDLIEFADVKTNEYPTEYDMIGSVKAMFILHYNYYLNITAAVYDGKLCYQDHHGMLREYQAYEKLSIHDIKMLADRALVNRDYALAIDLTRNLISILKQYDGISKNGGMKRLFKHIEWMKKNLMKMNNGYLEKEHTFIGKSHRTLTYVVDKHLKRKKEQPNFITNKSVYVATPDSDITKEWMWFRTCQIGKWLKNSYYYPGKEQLQQKPCSLLHHQNPYLKVGPFKEEMYSIVPYSVVFHDILTETEIDFLQKESTPKLSRLRTYNYTYNVVNKAELKAGERRRIIHKSVQAWFPEVEWPLIEDVDKHPYVGKQYLKMNYPLLWKLNKRISLATQMVTDSQNSGTPMQVTNYGLAGLCEPHIDPTGISTLTQKIVKETHPELLFTGDMIASFMAWLGDTEAGGGTAYINPGNEGVIMPERGAAAFWYDLKSDLTRDEASLHAGCPVIKGNKWILNKWLYSYDNFHKFPCKLGNGVRFSPPSTNHYYKSL